MALAVGIAVLFYLGRIPMRNKEWQAAFTKLDQNRERAKWYHWPSVLFTIIFAAMVVLFVIYEIMLIGEMLWSKR